MRNVGFEWLNGKEEKKRKKKGGAEDSKGRWFALCRHSIPCTVQHWVITNMSWVFFEFVLFLPHSHPSYSFVIHPPQRTTVLFSLLLLSLSFSLLCPSRTTTSPSTTWT